LWEEVVTLSSDEMARALEHYVPVRAVIASQAPLEEIREAYETQFGNTAFPIPEDVEVEEVDADGVHAFWVTAPGADTDRVVLYLHGGGYVMGGMPSIEKGHHALGATVSRASGARVLLVDYRLAPENHFPAPVEDILAAYRWLLAQGQDPSRIAVAGESVGGGLSVIALMAIRDAGLPVPAAGVAASPLGDLTFSGDSYRDAAKDPAIVREGGLMRFAGLYLDGEDPKNPLASPLFGDFAGLPPLLFVVGSAEALRDDTYRMVEAARAAGVDVTLREWLAPHSWIFFASFLPEAAETASVIGDFIARHTEKSADSTPRT
jgi:epsilon-lactone hydrolase